MVTILLPMVSMMMMEVTTMEVATMGEPLASVHAPLVTNIIYYTLRVVLFRQMQTRM